MEVNVILCNHAEVQNNQLYLAGGGIDRTFVPQGVPGPYGVGLALGIILSVPWSATNQAHKLELTLEDEDGHPVQNQTGPNTFADLKAQMQFNLGRPPTLDAGEEQNVCLAVNLPMLALPNLGRYVFILAVDGTVLRRVPYRISAQAGLTMSAGPTGLPQMG